MTTPEDWTFTGAQPVVASWTPPGWRQADVPGTGCLPASVATLLGLRVQLVALAMKQPTVTSARRVVEAWDEHLTLGYREPLNEPTSYLHIGLYRADDHKMHAAVMNADGSLYWDPHLGTWTDPHFTGFLIVEAR